MVREKTGEPYEKILWFCCIYSIRNYMSRWWQQKRYHCGGMAWATTYGNLSLSH